MPRREGLVDDATQSALCIFSSFFVSRDLWLLHLNMSTFHVGERHRKETVILSSMSHSELSLNERLELAARLEG